MPLTTYREWENGRKIVGEPYVALAELLEVSLYELMTGQKSLGNNANQSFEIIESELKKLKMNLLSK